MPSSSPASAPADGPRPTAGATVEPRPARGGTPLFSVVIPVHDGGDGFGRCLDALLRAAGPERREVIVVDDASRDGSGERAAARGLRVLRQPARRGPAAARNLGAGAASGEFLFFLDADCEVHADTFSQAERALAAEPALDALFGSYDDRPAAPGVTSQFKNLFHHWTHQRGAGEARTFWAGCGAIRRQRFLALGGFDERRYAEPSIEDIELGYRLSESGGRIRLAAEVQVRHLKRWTLASIVRTDLWRRGVPWTELLLERPGRAGELNVGARERLIVLCGLLVVPAAVAGFASPAAWAASALAAALLVLSCRGFYALVWRRSGVLAALAALPLHVLYCWCCAIALVVGGARSFAARRRPLAAHG